MKNLSFVIFFIFLMSIIPNTSSASLEYLSNHPSLQAAVDTAGVGGRVVVDIPYTDLGTNGVVLPRLLQLVGYGAQSYISSLYFPNLAPGQSALSVDTNINLSDYNLIEGLAITGPGNASNGTTGINLDLTQHVQLRRVVLANFETGISAHDAFYLDIYSTTVADCVQNVELSAEIFSCRIRDCTLSSSGGSGVELGSGNNNVISGTRFESNAGPGIVLLSNAENNHIYGNRFEGNDVSSTNFLAIRLNSGADKNFVMNNYIDHVGGQFIDDQGDDNVILEAGAGVKAVLPPINTELGIKGPLLAETAYAAQVFARYESASNSFKGFINTNNRTTTSNHYVGTGDASITGVYGGWSVQMTGGSTDAGSSYEIFYRPAGQNMPGTPVFSIDSDGNVTINGDVTVTGTITASGDANVTGTVTADDFVEQ